jgi:hypothetical protein
MDPFSSDERHGRPLFTSLPTSDDDPEAHYIQNFHPRRAKIHLGMTNWTIGESSGWEMRG